MKKLLLSISAVALTATVNAQLVNGNFEGTFTNPVASFSNLSQVQGWGYIIGKPETAAPGQGSKSAKLVTVDDAALAAAVSSPTTILSGQAAQKVKGSFANPQNIALDFIYKYTPVSGDSAVVVIEVYDTLAAGAADDKVLYQGITAIKQNVTTWTAGTIASLTASGQTGTPNAMLVVAGSSIGGLFGTSTPKVGSTFYVDDFKLKNVGFVGVADESIVSTVSVYPNPASDKLNVLSDEDVATLSIVTMDGKIVATANGSSIDVSALTTGMYVYTVVTVSGKTSKGTFAKN